MSGSGQALPGWRGRFFRRRERLTATWTLKGLLFVPVLVATSTAALWTSAVGTSLVCAAGSGRSQALLIENFDPDYLVFERAATLHQADMASRIFVPVWADDASQRARSVSVGTAELMARLAHLPSMELMPIIEREPITLNAAYQLRDVLARERITSVTIVSPGFRSRRSHLVYSTVFAARGIVVRCVPVFGSRTPANWAETWHGVQEVVEQLLKLAYYRYWVLA